MAGNKVKIACSIQGETPLLCNRFTEANAAKVSAGSSSAITTGGKGTPREQAEPKLYLTPTGDPMIPGPNVFAGIVAAGTFHKAGRKQITTGKSSLVPAGISIDEIECEIENPDGGPVRWEVDSRSVVNPSTSGRMMCHRPRFDTWRISFTLTVDESMFDEKIVRLLVDDLGSKIGLGDFRPARKGPFGRFVVVHWEKKTLTATEPKDVKLGAKKAA
jgi:hypothetical protein